MVDGTEATIWEQRTDSGSVSVDAILNVISMRQKGWIRMQYVLMLRTEKNGITQGEKYTTNNFKLIKNIYNNL
jgi:hypothetical protein